MWRIDSLLLTGSKRDEPILEGSTIRLASPRPLFSFREETSPSIRQSRIETSPSIRQSRIETSPSIRQSRIETSPSIRQSRVETSPPLDYVEKRKNLFSVAKGFGKACTFGIGEETSPPSSTEGEKSDRDDSHLLCRSVWREARPSLSTAHLGGREKDFSFSIKKERGCHLLEMA